MARLQVAPPISTEQECAEFAKQNAITSARAENRMLNESKKKINIKKIKVELEKRDRLTSIGVYIALASMIVSAAKGNVLSVILSFISVIFVITSIGW